MKAAFFELNRHRTMQALSGGIAVFTAYTAMQRTNDASFPFEQEASFWWLSGIEHPDWWLIIDGTRQKSWLVRPFVGETQQLFDGCLSDEEAVKVSGIADIMSHDDAMKFLRDAARHHSVVYAIGESPVSEYYDFIQNPAQKQLWKILERTFQKVTDCQRELAKLRAIKQPEEIKAIQRAINVTIEGFETIHRKLPALTYEYEVEAEFSYLFRKKGAAGHAYDPIVASGAHACTMHYAYNQGRLKKPGLLLMDVGARVDGYAADITRTYAVGEPTKRQVAVHTAVQTAHQRIINLLRPGLELATYLQQVDEIMQQALQSLGLLKTPEDYRRYFPHAISHGLGVDVHDSLGQPRYLEAGMVLTVEPGIYIPQENIGVRIEDDILITNKGHRNLSQKLATHL